jgi:hypothetical protein
MHRLSSAVSYANAASTVAIVIALSGTAAYAAGIVTSSDIRDGTIRSRDIHNRTITGDDLHTRSVHLRNLTDMARSLLRVNAAPPRISDYQDLHAIVSKQLPYSGYYVVFTDFQATNTGATDDSLNCAYRVNGTTNFAAGVQVATEHTAQGQSVTVIHATQAHRRVRFACQRNGSSTFDLSHIHFAAFRFG